MTDITISTSIAASPVRGGGRRLSPNHVVGLALRLFMFKAERWGRRARFYERHRDYFPRLFSSRFVARCRELETGYRGLALALFGLSAHDQIMPLRAIASQQRHGKRITPPHRLALTSMR